MTERKLEGRRVAFLAAPEGTEQVELTEPWKAVEEAGQDAVAVAFVRGFVERGKPVAAICHAPWMLIEAGVVDGRRLTSYPSLATDIRNAGGDWVDEEVVVDEGLVTSRRPDDLPAFCLKLVEEICEGEHSGMTRSA